MTLRADQIKARFNRLCEELFNKRRYELIAEFYAPDVLSHSTNGHPDLPPIKGAAAIKDTLDALHAAFPGVRHELDDVVVEPFTWTRKGQRHDGFKVGLRYHAIYHHTGTPYMGMAATGAQGHCDIMAIAYLDAEGRICEYWQLTDIMPMHNNLVAAHTAKTNTLA